jgi:hypothetical protein
MRQANRRQKPPSIGGFITFREWVPMSWKRTFEDPIALPAVGSSSRLQDAADRRRLARDR